MRRIGTDTSEVRHCWPAAAPLLLVLILFPFLTLACQDEAKVLPTSSPASDVAEPVGSPEASPTTEASASASPQLDEEALWILKRAQDSMSTLSTVHMSQQTTVRSGGQQLQMSVESDYELPDQSYSRVTSPNQIEVVTEGVKAYVRLPGQEWQTMEDAFGTGLEEMGLSPPDFEAQLDWARVADTSDVLADDEVEGVPVYHLRVSMGIEKYFAEASGVLGASSSLRDVLESARGGTVVADFYVGRDDFLIRKSGVEFTTSIMGSDLQYDGDATFSAFNEAVDIPEIE